MIHLKRLKHPNKCRELVPGVMTVMRITRVFRTITATWKVEESVLEISAPSTAQMEVLPNKTKQVAEQMPSAYTDYASHHLN